MSVYRNIESKVTTTPVPSLKVARLDFEAGKVAFQSGEKRIFEEEGAGESGILSNLVGRLVHQRLAEAVGEQSVIRPLSARELELFSLAESGMGNKDIAAKLGVSVKTVEVHKANIAAKVGPGLDAMRQEIARGFISGMERFCANTTVDLQRSRALLENNEPNVLLDNERRLLSYAYDRFTVSPDMYSFTYETAASALSISRSAVVNNTRKLSGWDYLALQNAEIAGRGKIAALFAITDRGINRFLADRPNS